MQNGDYVSAASSLAKSIAIASYFTGKAQWSQLFCYDYFTLMASL